MYKTLQSIVDQLESGEYQTKDGLHDLKMNAAFIALKQRAAAENCGSKTVTPPNNARKEILLCSYTGFCLANNHGICTDVCFCNCQRKTSSVA